MRSKNPELMNAIKEFVNKYYREHHTSPSTQTIGEAVGVNKSTVHRYLVEMNEKGILDYDKTVRATEQMTKCKTGYFSAPLVGSIRCGNPETEEEMVEEYVSLPESLFGKGQFYLLRAKGDSMVDAGIEEGVLTVAPDKEGYRVRKQYEKRSADLGEVKPDSGGGRQVYRDWRKQTQRDIRCKGLQICALGWQ